MNSVPKPTDDRRLDPHGGQPAPAASDATLRRIGDALQGLRYGSVLAIVQDGVVVQIERTEKTRFVR
jgi:hypothetical protein